MKKNLYIAILLYLTALPYGTAQHNRQYSIKTTTLHKTEQQLKGEKTTQNDPKTYLIRQESRTLTSNIVKQLPSVGDTVFVQFFDNKTLHFVIVERETTTMRGKDLHTLLGKTNSSSFVNATLIVSDEKIRAEINDLHHQQSYTLAFDYTQDHYIATETDHKKLQDAHPKLCQTSTNESNLPIHYTDDMDTTTLDYMIVFDTEGSRYAQQSGGIEVFAQAIVSSINGVFKNSGINAQFRLATVLLLDDYTATSIENGFSEILSNRRVRETREKQSIDLATMVIETSGSTFGLAIPEAAPHNAYSIVTASSAITLYSAAHEVAHNFGCQHSRDQLGAPGHHPYAVGVNNPPYHSVMSYGNGYTSRVPLFSSPQSIWKGVQLGSETENNVRKIKERVGEIAQFGERLKPQYRLNFTEWQPDQQAQQKKLEIKTDSYYFIRTEQEWIDIHPKNGFDNQPITLSVTQNNTDKERKGKVTISQRSSPNDTTPYTIPDAFVHITQTGKSTSSSTHTLTPDDTHVWSKEQALYIRTETNSYIVIQNLMGEKIAETTTSNPQTIISNIPKGIYLISIQKNQTQIPLIFKIINQ